jgi:Proteasome-substrate-size regulator, mid region
MPRDDANQYLVSMAKIFVYSISQDGEVRDATAEASNQTGLLAGSKALDTLDKLINSAENYFHPSNSGPWTTSVGILIPFLEPSKLTGILVDRVYPTPLR